MKIIDEETKQGSPHPLLAAKETDVSAGMQAGCLFWEHIHGGAQSRNLQTANSYNAHQKFTFILFSSATQQ